MSAPVADPRVGEDLPPASFGPITRTHIVRYAGASGDFNPVHHDEELARRSGLPSVFSIGMLQAGILAAYATDLFGPEQVRRYTARFEDRVWPGDVLQCSGRVMELTDRGGEEVAVVQLECRNQHDRTVVSASAEFSLAR